MRSRVGLILTTIWFAMATLVVGAPAANATTYYGVYQSGTGVVLDGQWWKDSNGYIHVSGYLKDTAGDNASAIAQVHFTEDCCSNKVTNNSGYGSSVYFHYASKTKAPSDFRIKVGRQQNGFASYGSWKSYSTW